MSERTAKYVALAFAAVSALFAPVSYLVDMTPFNATAFAGATLVFVYFAANAQLLVTPRAQWEPVSRRATKMRIAFVLGALLIVIGVVEAVVKA